MSQTKIDANYRRNLVLKQIVLAGGELHRDKIVSYAKGNQYFIGDVTAQITAILTYLVRSGMVKRHGNLFLANG